MTLPGLERPPWADRLGVVASAACALHCLLAALLPALLASAGLALLLTEEAEWAFVVSAAFLGVAALALGYRRHRSGVVAGVMAAGVVALVAGRVFESDGGGSVRGILASLLLIVGHVVNARARRASPRRDVS